MTFSSPTERKLEDLNTRTIGERVTANSTLVLPIGAIEQHGPHLPMSTDLVIASHVAEKCIERFGDDLDLWLLPPLAYAKSDEHAGTPGTMWLSLDTFSRVLIDLGRSISALPARRLVLLNAHGGNSSALAALSRELRRRFDLLTFLVHPFPPPDQRAPNHPHDRIVQKRWEWASTPGPTRRH